MSQKGTVSLIIAIIVVVVAVCVSIGVYIVIRSNGRYDEISSSTPVGTEVLIKGTYFFPYPLENIGGIGTPPSSPELVLFGVVTNGVTAYCYAGTNVGMSYPKHPESQQIVVKGVIDNLTADNIKGWKIVNPVSGYLVIHISNVHVASWWE